jgi:hypothetical protein
VQVPAGLPDEVLLIRVAAARFLYVCPPGTLTAEQAHALAAGFAEWWPGASLLIVGANEYQDASGNPIDVYRHDARSA